MIKYNWTIDDLKNRYFLLEKLRKEEKDPKKLDSIILDMNNLYECIIELEYPETEDMPKLLDNYNYEKEKLLSYKFLWEDIKFFHETTESSITKTPDLKRNSLSKKDILDLTHDFYKNSLDKFFFHNFLVQFRNRFDHIKFINDNYCGAYLGESINIPTIREAYISVMRNNDIEDVLTTIHEYEHATSIVINPNHTFNSNHTFCEIDTLFMELIAADYLDSIFKDGEALISKASTHGTHATTADLLSSKMDLINAEELYYKNGYTTNRILKDSAKRYCGLVSEEVDDIIQFGGLSYDYTISYIFAVELYNMYQSDREKAMYYLRKLVLLDCKTELEYFKQIKRMGIIPNLHMREFHQEINESIKKLQKKSK